ncbi:TetR/AcrR family transcriptional regulator [Devosia sp.]|uniref:TetR/AcrR family transcriptional regulator n=1 Tax=Devosia sp. TaxID=1871048 RepID=UPI00326481B1
MSNAEHSEATRATLVNVARREFFRGFAEVSTEDLARAAKLTRGALYHHYHGKLELFAAVVEALMQEMHLAIAQATRTVQDPWKALHRGMQVFLDLSERPEMRIILFVDGPAALGWLRWREMDAKYGLGLLQGALEAAMDSGSIKRRPVKPLAHLLLGALTEAAMLLGQVDAPGEWRENVEESLAAMLDGLRI